MKKTFVMALTIIVIMLNAGCEYENSMGYLLKPAYDTIRSYPGGGGIFVVKIDCPTYEDEKFDLTLNADPHLNARLTKSEVMGDNPLFEVVLNPDTIINSGDYTIRVTATHKRKKGSLETCSSDLVVQVSDWGFNEVDAAAKLELFKSYLLAKNPSYSEIFDSSRYAYATYTNILIVEHSTWLTANYEVRLCYHVMVPPYDWSKIRIRNRNNSVYEVALMSDTNNNISEIEVTDYPELFGY